MHGTLGDALTRSIIIGLTDWSSDRASAQLPGPRPEFFFVPTYAGERLKADPQLGPAMMRDLRAFYPASRRFVTTQRVNGADAIHAAWSKLVARRRLAAGRSRRGVLRPKTLCAHLTHEKRRENHVPTWSNRRFPSGTGVGF